MKLDIFTTTAADYESRYEIGSTVYFHPGIKGMDLNQARTHALFARIDGVNFTAGKVTYELAMNIGTGDVPDFYEALLVASVDSIFVSSVADIDSRTRPGPPISLEKETLVSLSSSYGVTGVHAERGSQLFLDVYEGVQEMKKG